MRESEYLNPRLIHGSLGPPESPTQVASRSVQPFCGVHECDQQTDTQTDHATPFNKKSVFSCNKSGQRSCSGAAAVVVHKRFFVGVTGYKLN